MSVVVKLKPGGSFSLRSADGTLRLFRGDIRQRQRDWRQFQVVEHYYDDDVIICRVNYPGAKETDPQLLILRDREPFRLRLLSAPVRLPYVSIPNAEFEAKYKISKYQHQCEFWRWHTLTDDNGKIKKLGILDIEYPVVML